MADDIETEIYKQHRDAQSKYSYFLLAAAGAALAFSVTQTQTAVLGWSMLPLGLAALCWGLSFYCGCHHLTLVESTLFSNLELFNVQRGQHPLTGTHPEKIAIAADTIKEIIN